MDSNRLYRNAFASLLALSAAAFTAGAMADNLDHSKDEKCAGVIKAGKNDCATSKNQCHGHVTSDRDPEAWIYVPKGLCDKVAGAHITNQFDPTPGVKQ